MMLRDYCIYDIIRRNAQLYPARDAVVDNRQRLTHAQYKDRCDRLAAGLVRAGLEKGDRLAVVAHNSAEFMILYGAAAKTGAIVLPVNWRLKPNEIAYVLKDGTPKFVFAGKDYLETITSLANDLPSVQKCYALSPAKTADGIPALDTLYTEQGADDEFDIPADAGFVIIHTAAVDGEPRGALLSQANIVYLNLVMLHQYQLDPEDCHLCIVPLFHIAGLSMAMGVMHGGGRNVLIERFDPKRALELIQQEKCTTFFNFSPILKMMLDKADEGQYDLSSIRNVTGLDHRENITRLLKLAPQVRYFTGFGQTEAMAVTGGLLQEKPGSAGRPSPLARVVLLDDDGNEVPVNVPGEICVRSPLVFSGYWQKPEATAYTFRNGWHHTGDIGRFDEDGFLWYVQRKADKELIKPGGENVYPAEVEKAILANDAVSETCVIGIPDAKWGEAIKAVCVLKPQKEITARELIEFVALKIASYKKPSHVVFVDALPKTTTGVIDRAEVKRQHGGRS